MRRFLYTLLLFSLPFQALLVYLLAAPYDKAWGWNVVLKDCRTGGWVYNRMHKNPKPVDVAFVGTSRTMCGIYDSLLQAKTSENIPSPLHIASFGVCRPGTDLHYALVKELIAAKKPRTIVVEVQTQLRNESHMHFPFVADLSDVAGAPVLLNKSWLYNGMTAVQTRLLYHRDKVLGIERKYKDELTNPDHSFVVVPVDGIAPLEDLQRARAKREKKDTRVPGKFPGSLLYSLSIRTDKIYYTRIAGLCKKESIRLVFLYIPGYGNPEPQPAEMQFFSQLGEVWAPPLQIFHDPSHFFDADHLNRKGATALAEWLSTQIKP